MSSYQKLKKEIERLQKVQAELEMELDTVCLDYYSVKSAMIIYGRKTRHELKKAMAFGNGAGTTEGNGILSLIK